MKHLQVDENGRLRHLLTLEGMSRELIHKILDNAASFLNVSSYKYSPTLQTLGIKPRGPYLTG